MNPSTRDIGLVSFARTRKASHTPWSSSNCYTNRHGRRFYNDESSPYMLPHDVKELARQSLFHELQYEMYGDYHCAQFNDDNIPKKVLDIGCGTGIWCASVAHEFAERGHPDVEFVGLDLVPVYGDMKGVNFTFVRHDFTSIPIPFPDCEFDYIFLRDTSWGVKSGLFYTDLFQEYFRVLKPGGVFEIQCMDHTIRTLQRTSTPYIPGSSAYVISQTMQSTKFGPAENPYIKDYNERIEKAFAKNELSPIPTTLYGALMLMADAASGVQARRLALPFDEVWWEPSPDSASESSVSVKRKSSVGSSVDGNSLSGTSRQYGHTSTHRRSSTSAGSGAPSPLTEEEKAVRQTMRLIFTQLVESLEPALRDINGIALDDWDRWYKDMVQNFENGGLRGGECVEFGCWWGFKKA